MRKMSVEQARSMNGGWRIYQCKRCGWRIMVTSCWLLHIYKITQYMVRPSRCPHCGARNSWKQV